MELHEYSRYDAIGLRGLLGAGEVSGAEVEAVAREALAAADAELNGLALPLFEPALDHAADGPLAGVPFLIKDIRPDRRGRAVRAAAAAAVQGSSRCRHRSDDARSAPRA